MTTIQVGDRARLWIGTPKRGGYRHGTVTGIDLPGLTITGIQVRFDQPVNGLDTCYATHAEVEVLRANRWTRETPPRTPTRGSTP